MKKLKKIEHELPSQVTAFWGTGASGVTSFCLEYARQLAELGRKTLLIDFDLTDPSLMVYLAVDNYPSGLQAGLRLASQQRLDAMNLNELIIESGQSSTLSFMAGLPVSGRFRTIDTESVVLMVEALSNWFDELVIDIGPLVSQELNGHAYSLQQELMKISNYLYGVFRADPEGIAKLFWLPTSGELIGNFYRPGSLGAGGKKGLRSLIAEMTGKPLWGVVEEDEYLIRAIATGEPVGDVSKRSSISTMITELMQNRLGPSG
jgi:septum formation inhibitor-activating ATPase MinD